MATIQLSEVVQNMQNLGQKKMVFLYDRGYTSLEDIKKHYDLGVDFLFRVPRNCFKEAWKRVDNGENNFHLEVDGHLINVSST